MSECFMDNRDNIVGFDFSDAQYDALFARHEEFHRFATGLEAYQSQVEEHLRDDPNGREGRALEKRINQMRSDAMDKLTAELALIKLKMAFGGNNNKTLFEELTRILKQTDPFARGNFYSQMLSQVENTLRLLASFYPVLASLVGEEEARTQLQPTVAGALYTYNEVTFASAKLVREDSLRSLRGYPVWDAETQDYVSDESLYVPPQPSFTLTDEGEIVEVSQQASAQASAQTPTAPSAAQEDETALLSRLFSGIKFD